VDHQAAVNGTEKLALPEFDLGTVQPAANEEYWFKLCFSHFYVEKM